MLGENELESISQISDAYYADKFSVMGYEIGIEDGCLGQALRKLPEKYLRIVLMYYFVGLNDNETAEQFGITGSTICDERHRAVEMLCRFMEEIGNV